MSSQALRKIQPAPAVPALPLLVVLPGMDGTCKLLDNFHSEIGKYCDVLAISYPTDRVMDYAQLTAYVAARLPKSHFVVLGESFSGPIAIEIAATHPNCDGLVLVSTFAAAPAPRILLPLTRLLDPKRVLKYLASIVLMSGQGSKSEEAALHKTLGAVPTRILQERLSFALKVNKISRLKQIQVPVLCLAGRQDRLIRLHHARRIAAAAPQCQLHEMDAPHLLLETHAAEASALIHKFSISCTSTAAEL